MSVELSLLIMFGLSMLFFFYLTHRAQTLIDRLSDKIMAERNPSAFATYGTVTPTAKEEIFHAPGNGKTLARTPGQDSLPSYLEEV